MRFSLRSGGKCRCKFFFFGCVSVDSSITQLDVVRAPYIPLIER
jgi:hypothetical protein